MAKLGEANIGGRMVPAWLLDLTAEELDGLKWHTNKSLLGNGYFVGGGSQQGGGQFPINQRGQTSYDTGTIAGYGIDGWWSIFCNFDVTTGQLSQSTSQTYGGSMRQAIESPGRLAGRTVVMSILVDRVTGVPSASIAKSSGINSGMSFIGSTFLSNGLNTLVVNLPNDVGGDTYPMLFVSINAVIGSSFRVIAAKLELGPTQTLAYQDEDGNWQLFETPDYGEELAKCQRYLLVLPGFDTLYSGVGVGSFFSETEAEIIIPTPTSMRIIPTCTATGIWMLRGGGQIINADANTANFFVQQMSSNSVSMIIGGLSGCPSNQAAQLLRGNNNTAKIIFSAEL